MKFNNTFELPLEDKFYLYCHKTQDYEVVEQLTEVKPVKNRPGMVLKGFDKEGNKLYSQITVEVYEKLKEKFLILKNYD